MEEEAKELAHYQSVIDLIKVQLEEVGGRLKEAQQAAVMAPPASAAGSSGPGRKRSRAA
jgi:hypothetical protein